MNTEQLKKAIQSFLQSGSLFKPELLDHREANILLLATLEYLKKTNHEFE